MDIAIRRTTDADEPAIHRLHLAAFDAGEAKAVADLAIELLHDPTAAPALSLAAEGGGEVVGHVLFTRVEVADPRASASDAVPAPLWARVLAPLAIAPAHQAKGVGGRLVRRGLEILADADCHLVFVLGDPGYYRRFGFVPATPFGLGAPYPIPPAYHDAWMALELSPGALGHARGTVRCAAGLSKPEHWFGSTP